MSPPRAWASLGFGPGYLGSSGSAFALPRSLESGCPWADGAPPTREGGARRGTPTSRSSGPSSVYYVRHLAHSTSWWSSLVLILVDSMVALGALAKGRSSSPPLLRFCRQGAAVMMAMDIRPMLRYIPSGVNPADGPSRGLPVGAAPETVLAHADRSGGAAAPPADALPAASLSRLQLGRSCAGFAGG